MFKGTGAQILVKALSLQGVERISSVAGESYLAVLDALLDYPEIETITCRQEGGAAFMAESWGKLTGKPGICFVTRGPGACNASIGIHTAMQDSTPMIMFMGQVRRIEKGREAFQEIDVGHVFGGLAKWTAEITDPARIPEIVNRAFTVAMSGRPGPVVIALPEDMLREETSALVEAPGILLEPALSNDGVKAITDLLSTAKKPLAIVGGTGWNDESCTAFEKFAKEAHIPVAASFRRQDVFSHNHDCYVGELGTGPNPKLLEAVKEADVILAVGTRLNEIMSQGYTLFSPTQKIIHIHASEHELGKVYIPALAIHATIGSTATKLGHSGYKGKDWGTWCQSVRQLYKDWTHIDTASLPEWNGTNVTAMYAWLRENLPADAVITTDAGNFSGWAQRYIRYGRPGRLLAPTSGAMGYGVPSAIGASLAAPDKLVLGLCGDGGFMMSGQELATAMHHGATPIIMIFNNGMYGTIRMHQERAYPGRVSATALTNPDFVALAQSYGAFSARVESAAAFPALWEQARKAQKLAVLEIKMDPRQITSNAQP